MGNFLMYVTVPKIKKIPYFLRMRLTKIAINSRVYQISL